MYAIVKTGGKQYKVAVGDVVTVEKLDAAPGDSVALPAILLVDGEQVTTDAAALADQDLAGVDQLAAEPLDAEPLGGGVTAVARAGSTLFVSHGCPPYFPLEMPVTLTRVSG